MENENSAPALKPIPVSLFSRKNNKTSTLINNTKKENAVEGKHRWFEFEFTEYVYVQEIQINATGYDDWNAVSLALQQISGKEIDIKSNYNNGRFTLNVGRFISGFRFKPDMKFNILSNQLITSIVVTGYTLNEFQQLENEIASIARDKTQAQELLKSIDAREQAAAEKISAAETHLNELKQQSTSLDKEIGQATGQLDALKSEISQNAKRRDELNSSVDDINKNLETLRTERRSEEALLAERKSQRAKLIEEIRLFPSEIGGFVQEAKRSIGYYILLSSIPMGIILYVTHYLYSSAVDLTQIHKSGDINVWNIFLTRIPFVVVSVTILQVCGILLKRFINEIVDINNQRLNLSAISIVAKDVSTASAASLDISPDEKFEMETRLKMSLLREQMRKYVSEKYEYRSVGTDIWPKRKIERNPPEDEEEK
jgi:hypothetical protein